MKRLASASPHRVAVAGLLLLACVSCRPTVVPKPDLVIGTLAGPVSILNGSALDALVEVCNRGAAPSGPTDVNLYLSSNAVIEGSAYVGPDPDPFLGGAPIPTLAPGACHAETIPAWASVPSEGAWHLGAFVDESGVVDERWEHNNRLAGDLIGVGSGPDLVVAAITGPPSAQSGSSFEAQVEVCNQGTQPSGPTDVSLYLSSDDQIEGWAQAGADALIGTLPVPPIASGQCHVEAGAVNASVPQDGAWTMGAIADESEGQLELIESNNTFAGALIGVGYAPDLVVASLTGPPSAGDGDTFLLAADVCNQGTAPSNPTEVTFYLSSDTVIEGSMLLPGNDPFLGSAPLPPLLPGECHQEETSVNAVVPEHGPYHLGAIVDEIDGDLELIESNNTFAGALIGVGYAPDLVVASLTGPPSVENGMQFQAQVEVCNQGTQPSAPTEVALYLTQNDHLEGTGAPSAEDQFLGGAFIPPLTEGGCHDQLVDAWPFVPVEGEWTLAAFIDELDQESELIESNNTLLGDSMGVGFGSDLVVADLSGPPSVENGNSFDVQVEVCNRGTQASTPSDVTLYFSTDMRLDGSLPFPGADAVLGNAPVQPLAPGECRSQLAPAWANVPTEGAWYLGAIVDESDFEPELIESNNERVGALTGVGFGSDLVIARIEGPSSTQNGATFDAEVEVCNQGTASSNPSDVSLYLSQDLVIDGASPFPPGGDPFLGSLWIQPLAPGQCDTQSGPMWTSVFEEGAYHLGGIVDEIDSEPELVESNNAFAGPLIGVGLASDLIVTRVDGPPSARNGEAFDAHVEVCNQGTAASGPTDVTLYLSSDTQLGGSAPPQGGEDPFLTNVPIAPLAPGECRLELGPAWVSVPDEGAWYLGAIVDELDFEPELIESNNTFVAGLMGIGWGSDLVVRQLVTPPSVQNGGSLDVQVEVCNQGTQPSAFTDMSLYLSSDTRIDGWASLPPGQDPFLGNLPVSPLAVDECRTEVGAMGAFPPSDGAWYVGAIVDETSSEPELIESNNSFVSGPIGIGFAPDLVIASVTGPTSVEPGTGFTAEVDVCNQGTAPSGPTDVTLYASEDEEIESGFPMPGGDSHLGTVWVPALAPGECQQVMDTVWADVPTDGAWFLGGVVDEFDVESELIESNNRFAGALLGIGFGSDLTIAQLVGAAAAPNGGSFDADFEVCNQGTAPSGTTDITFYLSSDAVIEGSFPMPGPDVFLDMRPIPPLAAGLCHADTVSLTAAAPNDGLWFLGGLVDEFDAEPELIESNNELAEHVIDVGPLGP